MKNKIAQLKYQSSHRGCKENDILLNKFDITSFTEEELQKILNSYYVIENIEKPLKAFSNYKLDELVFIAQKLNINIYDEHAKKKKKQELYENILQKLI